jgi:NAD(P)H-hydrate epimerase
VLKGAKTVVAAPDGTIYLNVTGNSGMGTAGSGDVLAGMVGSLLAQGLTPLEASACAVYCHGLAGDRGAESIGKMALTAGDLLGYLPQVLKELEDFKEIKRPVTRRRLIRIF